MTTKPDIRNLDDIKLFVDTFYGTALKDESIGHFFNEVAKIDMVTHMPTMYTFWNAVLFGEAGYSNNTVAKHLELNQKSSITDSHFDRWRTLFFQTIDELFEGKVAELAKTRAESMIFLMKFKIEKSQEEGFIQ
jgi:hemoglobin